MQEPCIETDPTTYLQASVDMTIRIGQETTCRKFNDMLKQFLCALQKAYAKVPEIAPKIKLQAEVLAQLIERNSQFVLTHFNESCKECRLDTMNRDDFIQSMLPKIGVFRGFRIHEFWDQTPERTKKTIWKYIKHLWELCKQFEECGNHKELTSQALKMLKSEQFAALMKKTLETVQLN